MNYPNTKFLGICGGDKDCTMEHKPQWVERLICSWNVFCHSLEKMQLTKIKDEKLEIEAKVELI